MYIEDGAPAEKAVLAKDKKNVLLIGDSIRRGYCETVKNALSDIANVFFPDENCRNTQYVLTSLYSWSGLCDAGSVDAVHFNCGHWDIAHWNGEALPLTDLDTYAQNIGRIIGHLRAMFPSAKIYFAATTPMNPNQTTGRNPRTTDEIRRYNLAAAEAARAQGVEIDDLFSLMEHCDESWYTDYCHYTAAGFTALGEAVAAFLRARI